MISYKLTKNSKTDIEKLKQDLMESSAKTSNSIFTSIKQVLNENTGKLFEDNIRHLLISQYGFEKCDFSQQIFKKTILFNNNKDSEVLLKGIETIIKIENKSYKFLFDEKYEVHIWDENNVLKNTIDSKFNNIAKTLNIKDTNNQITISSCEEMEIDGFFKIKGFSKDMFDKKEVSIIYSNIDNEKCKNIQYCIMEAKLSPKKVNKLIKQIRLDNNLLKTLNIKDAIILGFINSSEINDKKHFNTLKNFNCIIYGIKDSKLCNKNITYPIDWDLNERFDKFSDNIISKIEKLTKLVKEMREKKEREAKIEAKLKKDENIEGEEEEVGKGEEEEGNGDDDDDDEEEEEEKSKQKIDSPVKKKKIKEKLRRKMHKEKKLLGNKRQEKNYESEDDN